MKRVQKIGIQGHEHRMKVGIRHGREASRRGRWKAVRNCNAARVERLIVLLIEGR